MIANNEFERDGAFETFLYELMNGTTIRGELMMRWRVSVTKNRGISHEVCMVDLWAVKQWAEVGMTIQKVRCII